MSDIIGRQMYLVDPDREAEVGCVLHECTAESLLLLWNGNGHALCTEDSAGYVQDPVVCPECAVAEAALDAYFE